MFSTEATVNGTYRPAQLGVVQEEALRQAMEAPVQSQDDAAANFAAFMASRKRRS